MFVVYHKESTQQIKVFAAASDAKRSTTCMNRNANASRTNHLVNTNPYAYTDMENYSNNVVYNKKVVNLMSGKEIEIRSNTPRACDPSTETYWSM